MNIAQHVERMARNSPQHPAIRFEGKSVSYAVLNDCAGALAGALKRKGVRRGDRVALYLPNIPAFALAYVAILKAGAIAVSINSIFKAEETKFILNDSGAKVVFTVAELLSNVPREECRSVEHVVLCEGSNRAAQSLDDWLALGEGPRVATEDMQPDDPAALLYSSGTTGFPKGVTLTHNNIVSNIRTAAKYSGYLSGDGLAVFLPLFHVFAQNYIMNAGFEAGATLVLFRRFVPDVVLAAIRNEGITMFFAVPTIYIALLSAQVPKETLGTIRYFFSAAATMPEEISRRWTDTYGLRVSEGYGLTECSPFAAYNHKSKHKFGSVGTAVDDFEIRIVDENDNEVPRGQWGEIAIRGPGVMKGYWNNAKDTQWALRGGWLHSGDIGRMDEENYVYIVDRVKDMINVSGFKVWPAEVENMLYRHPAVKELAVYGAPDPAKGEKVNVAIVLKEGASATAEDIIAYCRDKLAVYKAPEKVDFVSELPKSATGKILKRILRDQSAKPGA
ncbi:MAG: long-chain fatty acid--CoA ligase [Betaproteobacteria bacterium RIFCSPLOWO2_12_FULL_63_13]|nr:MAG: long-chain fatty acid--CoA ligase [Betaproteobacteria bacterium RIFCSPLOWO2_02_FULL_63_19]OGA47559.1 MAG: long-chain fatty acid--CoA ligase [Betaproteobacteria bacterium RIFCSPLOWO2_12_FULL_63_13]